MQLNGSDIIMECLLEQGVDTVFGYPGGAVLNIYDALYKYRDRIRHIETSHEQGAAHAADGYARASGKTGVVIATSGPGATNLVTGIATAYMNSIPLVAITGNVGRRLLGLDSFQEVDITGVTMPITKHNYIVKDIRQLADTIREAFYLAQEGRRGPVLVDIPKDISAQVTEYEPKAPVCPPLPVGPSQREIANVAELLSKARRPFLYLGGGVMAAEGSAAAKELAERLDAPVACSLMCQGGFDQHNRRYMGMLGMHGNYAPNIKEQECDVLIAIGMRFSDRVTGLPSTYAKQAKIIHLDIDPAEINKCIKADIPVIGDCKMTLPAITRLLKKNEHRSWRDSFKVYEEEENTHVVEPAIHPTAGPLLMGEVVNAVAEATKGEAVLVTDVGQNQMFSSRYFKYMKKRSIVTSGGLGTMGFGMPAAVGATFGAPERTICMFCGDGGFQMNIQELGTIMEQQAPVKMILLNNNYLGNVRQWQDMFFNHRQSFTKMINPCYEQIASAYGIAYQAVTDRSTLAAAIEKMLTTQGPFIMECAIKEDDNVLPMTPPGKSVNEMLLEI